MEEAESGGQVNREMDDGDELDPRSRSIAEKRALGQTHKQLAAAHNVSEKTIQRTLAVPAVEELVFSLQSNMFDEATAQLVGLSREAVETLGRIMRSGPEAVAAQVAMRVLDRSHSLMGARRLERRFLTMVEAIESALKELT